MKQRFSHPLRSFHAGALAAVVAVSPLFFEEAPVAAAAETPSNVCVVNSGELKWGLKESFRAYISGSIANGSWSTSEGADYETPSFVWTEVSGQVDPETLTGSVSFKGSISFTGHEGVLDLTLSNPTIEFEGSNTAALLIDAKGSDVEGNLALDEKQVWFADVSLPAARPSTTGEWSLLSLPTTLTNSGAQAFADFYAGGTQLDPLDLVLQLGGCDLETLVVPESTETPSSGALETQAAEQSAPTLSQPGAAENGASIPWVPLGIGAVALVVIGLTLGLLISGRKPREASSEPGESDLEARS